MYRFLGYYIRRRRVFYGRISFSARTIKLAVMEQQEMLPLEAIRHAPVGVILSVIAECEDEAAWPLFGVDICHEFPHARFSTEKYSEIYGKIIHIGRGLHLRVYDVMESNLTFDDFALGTNAARKASARLWKTMLSAYDEN